jgi:lipooligosaccharide transport system permease protein
MNRTAIATVFLRQFLSWRSNWRTFLLMRLVEPAIFFYGIGLGLGHFIPQVNGHSYLSYLLPGSVSLALMFAGLFEGTYNAYSRAYMQRTWFSYLATPCNIRDIMLGEMAWCAVRTMLSTLLLIAVGLLLGAKASWWGTLLALPFMTLTVLSIMTLGYALMSFANSMNDFDYIWAFLATPMMVFSGVMVDIAHFPPLLQLVTWLLPLTHTLKIVRPLMLGEFDLGSIALHGSLLLALTVGAFMLALRNLTRKIQA